MQVVLKMFLHSELAEEVHAYTRIFAHTKQILATDFDIIITLK